MGKLLNRKKLKIDLPILNEICEVVHTELGNPLLLLCKVLLMMRQGQRYTEVVGKILTMDGAWTLPTNKMDEQIKKVLEDYSRDVFTY